MFAFGISMFGVVVLAGWGTIKLVRASAHKRYNKTDATIVKCDMELINLYSQGPDMYCVNVVYRYEVEGRSYESTRLTSTGIDCYAGSARVYCIRFAKDSVHPTYFNPADPSESVLIRSRTWPAYLMLGLAVLGGWLAWLQV